MAFEFALFSCFSSPSPSPALLKDFVFYKSVSLVLESWISSLICARHFVPLKLHFYISSQWSFICRLLLTFTLIKLNPFIIPLSYKELWRWGAQKNGCKRLNCLGKGALLVANEDAFLSCIKMIIKNIDRCFFFKVAMHQFAWKNNSCKFIWHCHFFTKWTQKCLCILSAT